MVSLAGPRRRGDSCEAPAAPQVASLDDDSADLVVVEAAGPVDADRPAGRVGISVAVRHLGGEIELLVRCGGYLQEAEAADVKLAGDAGNQSRRTPSLVSRPTTLMSALTLLPLLFADASPLPMAHAPLARIIAAKPVVLRRIAAPVAARASIEVTFLVRSIHVHRIVAEKWLRNSYSPERTS